MNAKQRRQLFSEIVAGVYLFVLFLSEVYGVEILEKFRQWKEKRKVEKRGGFKTGPITFCKKKVNLITVPKTELPKSKLLIPRRFTPAIKETVKPIEIVIDKQICDHSGLYSSIKVCPFCLKRFKHKRKPEPSILGIAPPDHDSLIEAGSLRNYKIRIRKRFGEGDVIVENDGQDVILNSRVFDKIFQ